MINYQQAKNILKKAKIKIQDEEISINLKDNTSPIIALENSNSNLVYVLMPMRVQNLAKIKNIEFKNFRNFENFKTSFENKINILFGDNGCGKTNILEGISLIAKGRGIRNSNISNLINKNKDNFFIKNNLEIQKNNYDIEVFTEKKNDKLKKLSRSIMIFLKILQIS